MIIATSAARARMLTEEFTAGTIRKEYVARVKGKFPKYVIVLTKFSEDYAEGCLRLVNEGARSDAISPY